MSNIVVKVEQVGKLYRLGQIGTGTLSHDISRWLARVRGKEDPFSKIGEQNDRTRKGQSDYVWALNDVSFEVRQGEVLGIIGRNGAGKSTLLKLLSKVTKPTRGRMMIRGRIASLLEVGTGFHPEMSGRENIYLNGAILGMTRREITAKFDEIVDFAGVERYVDTPVKRYSSGMYVRLAFAVAAFLEPEILIVDEVLAVGDTEFQKKCLGRIRDVSVQDGRTVLFVSHNMAAVKNLCNRGIVLDEGRCVFDSSNIDACINAYMGGDHVSLHRQWDATDKTMGNENARLLSVKLLPADNQPSIFPDRSLDVEFRFVVYQEMKYANLSVTLKSAADDAVICCCLSDVGPVEPGREYTAVLRIPENFLNNKLYALDLFVVNNGHAVFFASRIITFEVVDRRENVEWYGEWSGYIRPRFPFNILQA